MSNQRSTCRTRNATHQAFGLVGPSPKLLATHLISHFQIAPGCGLSLALTPDGPKEDSIAVRDWVRRQLAEMATIPVDNVMIALEQSLLTIVQSHYPHAAGEIDVPSSIALRSRLPLPQWRSTRRCLPRQKRQRTVRHRGVSRLSDSKSIQPIMHKEESA